MNQQDDTQHCTHGLGDVNSFTYHQACFLSNLQASRCTKTTKPPAYQETGDARYYISTAQQHHCIRSCLHRHASPASTMPFGTVVLPNDV
jgi:hypothetical protein